MKLMYYLNRLFQPRLGDVWMLHRVTGEHQDRDARCNGVKCAGWTVTPDELEEMICLYVKRGYSFVSIDQVMEAIAKPLSLLELLRLNKRWICITLDDGYLDNYTEALPVFRKYGIPFCLFVATGYLGGKFTPRTDCPVMMSEDQLHELSNDPLCTIGAHTVHHPDMSRLSLVNQMDELSVSRNHLEAICGRQIVHCAVPGRENPHKEALAREAGFHSQLNGWGGHVRRGCNPFGIPRIIPKVSENV